MSSSTAPRRPSRTLGRSVSGRSDVIASGGYVVLSLDGGGQAAAVYGPFASECEADAFGSAHTPVWTIWPLRSSAGSTAHPFTCAVCKRFGHCDGGADKCDPTDAASHVHHDCMESF